MKTFFIYALQYVTLFVTDGQVTTLHFNETIETIDSGAQEGDIKFERRRNNKSLSLYITTKDIDSNLKVGPPHQKWTGLRFQC
jgi:hypothetical protein